MEVILLLVVGAVIAIVVGGSSTSSTNEQSSTSTKKDTPGDLNMNLPVVPYPTIQGHAITPYLDNLGYGWQTPLVTVDPLTSLGLHLKEPWRAERVMDRLIESQTEVALHQAHAQSIHDHGQQLLANHPLATRVSARVWSTRKGFFRDHPGGFDVWVS